jgi:hypothetical protein
MYSQGIASFLTVEFEAIVDAKLILKLHNTESPKEEKPECDIGERVLI